MPTAQKAITATGTGLSFVIFMIWGFLLGVVLFPSIRLFKGKRARKAFHRQVRISWRSFIEIMKITQAFKSIEVTGLENLPANRPCLLIANHLTLVDIVVLGAHVPDFNCVVKMGLWNHPFFGSVVRACDFIPNVASEAFIEQCQNGFSQNRPLIIFPQGSRYMPDVPIKFQRGAAQVAVRTGVDVHPVIYTCSPVTLAKGMPWYKVPPSPKLRIEIQPALPPPGDFDTSAPIPKQVRQLNAWWEQYFKAEIEKRRSHQDIECACA
ncbi:MAG: 1-acyl-sn-glycerol-3-phosphate acyltransferase [Deltaproteobacteria bacterium]|nr:1-acyl-sn-glycerol-3-phosphate acyltransferase [Deltaproteobacteria bacterium]